jgi:hypothetical protein
MQRAAVTLMVIAAFAAGIVALVVFVMTPPIVSAAVAVSVAIAWCRFLERSTDASKSEPDHAPTARRI